MQKTKTAFYWLALFILLLISIASDAQQQTTVTFKILNTNKEPLAYATVQLISVPDTVNKQEKISDTTGVVLFSVLLERPYLVRITSANYEPIEKAITIKSDNAVYNFTAQPLSKSLTAVVVTSTKPLMRQEDDKTIVDPENLANSSTNAYEIMEKTPGLFVDQDGNIYLSSTTPATVHINGREQKMSAADIATMLKSLPPNSIASIEILRTPSAKYDASGSGGIVNVILKKGVRIGLTGSVNTGMNQGVYGNQFLGFNLNNNNGQTTSYINMQVSRRNTFERIETDRLFVADSMLMQDAYTKYPAAGFYTGYGISHELNKNWTINYDGRFNFNDSKNRTDNQSVIEKVSTKQTATSNLTQTRNNNRNFNTNQSLSLKYKIDSLGSEWTTDLSYTYAPNNSKQVFDVSYLLPAFPTQSGNGEIDNKLHFFSAQTNFTKKLAGHLTIETGIKTTNVIFNNNTEYFAIVNGNTIKDVVRTRTYKYNEGIHAAYLQASKTIAGITIKAGTRMENTNMKGVQKVPYDTSFNLNRTDFFPYVYISRNIMKIASYDLRAYLVYRKTISRPAYEYLNPSIRYIDQYLLETGNPSLRPQLTNNYEANVSVDERPIIAIGYNDTKDIFTNVIYRADSNNQVAVRTYDNLGTNKETYFRALGAIPPGKRYFFVVGAQYNHNFYNGLYESKPLTFKKGTWTIFTYQTFKITPLMQATLNGFARFKGQQQLYELSSFGALNFSLNQQFFKKKLIATVSISDIFLTNRNEFTISQGNVTANGFREGDTRRFGFNIRYNFGIRKKEENNIFNVESPERTN
jgi:iron complex outermembrane recepter protein